MYTVKLVHLPDGSALLIRDYGTYEEQQAILDLLDIEILSRYLPVESVPKEEQASDYELIKVAAKCEIIMVKRRQDSCDFGTIRTAMGESITLLPSQQFEITPFRRGDDLPPGWDGQELPWSFEHTNDTTVNEWLDRIDK